MTAAVVFTVISAVLLLATMVAAIMNVASAGKSLLSSSDNPLEGFGKSFGRHGILAALSTLFSFTTVGGVVWIIVVLVQQFQ